MAAPGSLLEKLPRLLTAAPSSSVLKELKRDELCKIAEIMKLRGFTKGELVLRVGETATWFGIVLDGQLKAAIPKSERWPGAAAGVGGSMQVHSKVAS
eukprot:6211316-Pleurochrysis_carterae.AAC.2